MNFFFSESSETFAKKFHQNQGKKMFAPILMDFFLLTFHDSKKIREKIL